MLLSKTVQVRWNGYTRKWYEDRGYKWTKQNEYFECKIEDIQRNSTAKVEAKCEYCGEIYHPQYRQLLNGRKIINKDCCSNRKCMVKKSKESNLIVYGVENNAQREETKIKMGNLYRINFKIVQQTCEEKGLILLSKEYDYKSDRSRLKIICSQHKEEGIQDTNFANIKTLKGCCKYGKFELAAQSTKLDGQFVYEEFIKAGLEPQFKFEDYEKSDKPLPYICPKHRDKGIQYKNHANLKYSDGCVYCGRERTKNKLRESEDKVILKFKSKGLKLIENQHYENKDKIMYYTCNNHPNIIQHASYNALKNTKTPCDYCRAEESFAKINRRFRSSISQWKKNTEKYNNNRCILSGIKENYQVHHLYSYNDIIKDALNNLNLSLKNNVKEYSGEELILLKDEIVKLHNEYGLGVCLNEKLHIILHQKYSKNCTNNDYGQFRYNYFNGIYDSELKEDLKSYNSIKRLKELNMWKDEYLKEVPLI